MITVGLAFQIDGTDHEQLAADETRILAGGDNGADDLG
jgi:hypothetical protein